MIDLLRQCRSIIFDFDGTIIDSNEIKLKCFIDLFSDQEFLKNDLIHFISSLGDVDRFTVIRVCGERFFQGKYSEYDIQTKIESFNEECFRRILIANKISCVVEFIKTASSMNYDLFISSATPENELVKIIKALDLSQYFQKVLGGPNSKVHHINTILEHRGLSAAEVVYIGDSDIDQTSATITGCHFIGIINKVSRFSIKPKISFCGFDNIINDLTRFEGKQ